MAFCTNCGANVTGAFCNQCGTPAAKAPAGTGAPAFQPVPPPPVMAQPVPGAPAAARKTSPIVWIFLIVGVLFVLGIVERRRSRILLVHKAKQAGLDTDMIQRNPAYAIAKMAVAANPDLSEVSHDDRAGTITLRDNKTGKVMTMNFDDIKNGKIRFSGTDDNGKAATVEIGGGDRQIAVVDSGIPGFDLAGHLRREGGCIRGRGRRQLHVHYQGPDVEGDVLLPGQSQGHGHESQSDDHRRGRRHDRGGR